jgi:hypothetical protein
MTELERFVAGCGSAPEAALIREHHLAAWTFVAAGDAEFRSEYLRMLARHYAIRRELLPLLAAWAQQGIEFMPFKGFWLSETMYPVPGARYHGDVDILVEPSLTSFALTISLELGWELEGRLPRPHSAAAFNVVRRGGETLLDAHRYLLHSNSRWNRASSRITERMWCDAVTRRWCGVPVRDLLPVDAFLVLVLHRCWGESWQFKPADALDLPLLLRAGVTREQLEARAAELRCHRTLRLFLERCDPWQQRIDLRAPSRVVRIRYDRSVLLERPLLRLERRMPAIRRAPELLLDMVILAPTFARAYLALRRHRALPAVLKSVSVPVNAKRSSEAARHRTVSAARWTGWLMQRLGMGSCLLRALALYRALRQQGWAVTFMTGVRRTDGAVSGHAWIEYEGRVLPELREPVHQYAMMFRYPDQSATNAGSE